MNAPRRDAAVTEALPPSASPQLRSALKDFMGNLSQHSRKNSELIDVLVQALKTVNQDLQQQKLKNHLLEARLKKSEFRMDELERVMGAFRRQGWLQ